MDAEAGCLAVSQAWLCKGRTTAAAFHRCELIFFTCTLFKLRSNCRHNESRRGPRCLRFCAYATQASSSLRAVALRTNTSDATESSRLRSMCFAQAFPCCLNFYLIPVCSFLNLPALSTISLPRRGRAASSSMAQPDTARSGRLFAGVPAGSRHRYQHAAYAYALVQLCRIFPTKYFFTLLCQWAEGVPAACAVCCARVAAPTYSCRMCGVG